ncbi:MAG: enoyl-CoA hydratase/isomerase family protein [Dehalococcoidia bacterium]
MAKLDLKLNGKVAVVTLDQDDNRLNLDLCLSLLATLDEIEKETDALTLVIKSGHAGVWSNGFDIDWINARLAEGDKETVTRFLAKDIELRRRLLTYPLLTIAAINGHVFGGGAVLSCCFDFRFMLSQRGYFCIPAVDRGYPIVPGTAALLKQVMPMYMVEDIIFSGRRFTGKEAAASGIITSTYNEDEFIDKIMAFAVSCSKGRWIVGEMKKVYHLGVLKQLATDMEHIEPGAVRV